MADAEANIRAYIRQSGHISFADFMAMALYGPGGYYTQGQPVGASGDYYTSPATHPVFGALLALQLEQMWVLLGKPTTFTVVEGGAGNGALARDILAFTQALDPDFSRAVQYVAMDGNPRHTGGRHPHLHWLQASGFPLNGITGCILSNELFDALPVHRVRMYEGRIQELYLDLDGDTLREVWGEPSSSAVLHRLGEDGAALQEGWEGEVGLAAAAWLERAAAGLSKGYAITIDYGDTADLLFTPERSRGTVMSYYQHTLQGDPYARIGRQDITAHANFTTLIEVGKAQGLQPVTLMTQAEFLRHLGIEPFFQRLASGDPAGRQAQLSAVRDLVDPKGLGNFRVLVQAKGARAKALACLGENPSYGRDLALRLPSLPLPRLTAGHINLLAGRYPHQAP